MNTFVWEFDELPLVIHNGIEAAFINGAVEIEYDRHGEWNTTHNVTVEGFGDRVDGKRQWPQVPAPEALAIIIFQRLEKEWAGKVYDAVREQLASDREDAADRQADYRRDRLMEDM